MVQTDRPSEQPTPDSGQIGELIKITGETKMKKFYGSIAVLEPDYKLLSELDRRISVAGRNIREYPCITKIEWAKMQKLAAYRNEILNKYL